MKGFAVLHEACRRLWQRRQDFELVATGDPPGRVDAFTRFVGWLSQEELPRHLRAADVLVMPTVAQEALGRTAVEAMAVGRPVIASRLGGLPFTVLDGATGLLCEPGDPDDLGRKIEMLLDDADLRQRLDSGEAVVETQIEIDTLHLAVGDDVGPGPQLVVHGQTDGIAQCLVAVARAEQVRLPADVFAEFRKPAGVGPAADDGRGDQGEFGHAGNLGRGGGAEQGSVCWSVGPPPATEVPCSTSGPCASSSPP